jgi:hypothetical protein
VGALVVACGVAPPSSGAHALPALPGKADLDPLLEADVDRLVVVGSDASLAAVVLRLLRTSRLGVAVGFVPVGRSFVSWGVPSVAALGSAVSAFPLIRDDSGGVLMGQATIGPLDGEAYCDDVLALRGRARLITVSPGADGVVGRVRQGFRTREYRGRAFQVGCHSAAVVSDGVAHPRPVQRWTWYRHTEDLKVIAGY